MLRKLLFFAITSGLATKAYKKYRASRAAPVSPASGTNWNASTPVNQPQPFTGAASTDTTPETRY